MATIHEVAALANVSLSTVSRVISGKVPVAEEKRKKVLQAIAQLGYQPNVLAQGLRGARLKTIALLLPNVRNLVFPAAIRAIEDVANRHGYMVIICNTDNDLNKETFYISSLRQRLIDGIIFSTASTEHDHILQLKQEGFPVVTLIRHFSDEVDSVILDNEDGGYQATKYLLSRGLTKIVLLNGALNVKLYKDRYEGYRKAMTEAGISVKNGMVWHDIDSWEVSYNVMTTMLKAGNVPEAVFATSDPKALGVMHAIYDLGLKIPEDISVMGFDNSDVSSLLQPPLTTVAQPFYDMGVAACDRLIKLIEGKNQTKPQVKILSAELMIRQSVI